MKLHNTILALQMMNGVKVYAVKFLANGDTKVGKDYEDGAGYFDAGKPTLSSKVYCYKSAEVLAPDTFVLVPTYNGRRFQVAKVVREVIDVDFDDDGPRLLWVNQKLDDPSEVFERNVAIDNTARRKLAASQARKAAEEHLSALGLNASEFAIENKTEGKDNA